MQNYIKAIPTEYKGVKFRSKLESNYAKLFDYFGMNWMYEVEGYQFPDGTWYLPDFYFPDQDLFVEVKGIMGELDEHKIDLLNQFKPVIVGFPDGSLKWYEFQESNENSGGCCNYETAKIMDCFMCGKTHFQIPADNYKPDSSFYFWDGDNDIRLIEVGKCPICGRENCEAMYEDSKEVFKNIIKTR